jgi:hypothetical protein
MTKRRDGEPISKQYEAMIYRQIRRDGYAMLHSVRLVQAISERVRAGTGPWPPAARREFTRLWYAFQASPPRRLRRQWALLYGAAMELAQAEAEAQTGED